MPDLRALAVSLGAAAAVSGYLILWWHWSVAVGVAIGILIGASALVTSVSLAEHPEDADRAWREAAPDLLDPADARPRPAGLSHAPTEPARPAERAAAEPETYRP